MIYTNKVRVIDSTYYPTKEKRAMIGKELEVRGIVPDENTVAVYTSEKKDDWEWFNLTDVVFLTPYTFEGKSIGIEDVVEDEWGKKGPVTSFYEYDGKPEVVFESEVRGTIGRLVSELAALHQKGVEETVEINDKKYNKQDVEDRLSELTPIE